MTFDVETLKLAWMVFTSFLAFGAWVYAWVSQRRSATLELVQALERAQHETKVKISVLEKDVQYGPSHEEMKILHGRLTDLGNQVSHLSGGVDTLIQTNQGLHEQLININNYLLSQSPS